MKLSQEQIQQVEDYLNNKDVEYIDLHLEVLDHISTAIESEMTENEISFNNAFEKVKTKWNDTFSYKSSYWLGTSNGGSKLFIDHCLKIYKPITFKMIFGIFLFVSLFYWSVKSSNIDLLAYKSIINYSYIIISIMYVLLTFYWKFKIKKTNLKSVYSYLYNKQIVVSFFSIFLFLVLDSFNSQQEFKYSKFLMFTLFVAILVIGYIFYKSHLKAVSNYKKYQLK